MTTLLQDIRYALRLIRQSPGLALVAILSLALGIGPNAAIFSVIDAVGFRPLPVRDPGGLIRLYSGPPSNRLGETSYDDFVDVRNRVRSFSEVAAWGLGAVGVTGGGRPPEVTMMASVSGNFFSLVGITPIAGRVFEPGEVRERNSEPIILISDAYWKRRFERSPGAINSPILLNNHSYTILGVLPPEFRGLDVQVSPDIWMPMGAELNVERNRMNRERRSLSVLGRLREGVTLAQTQAELDALAAGLAQEYPATNKDRKITIEFEATARRQRLLVIAAFLLLIPGIVLLIACANVAGLLLGRAEARRNEIAVRLAIGATRLRLIRQLLTESAVLAVMAGGIGMLMGYWIVCLLPSLIPPMPLPLSLEFHADARMMAFAMAVALVAVPAFGLAPALFTSKPDLVPLLKGERGRRRRLTFRNALVVGQITLSLTLLLLSGLLVRSLVNSGHRDPGFTQKPMFFCSMSPGIIGYDEARSRGFYQRFLDRLSALPSVESATLARHVPLNNLFGGGATLRVSIPGYRLDPGEETPRINYNVADQGYFHTMGVRILRGRAFTAADRWPGTGVVLINQTMAKRYWPDEDPVGKWVDLIDRRQPEQVRCRIAGIVQDGKYVSFNEAPIPYLYVPFGQQFIGEATLIVRTRGNEARAIEDFRRELQALDPSMPTLQITTLRQHMQFALILERVSAILTTILGSLALLLAVVGLYGIISYLVSRRTREIGIRMALGARPADVVLEVIRQGGTYAAIGIALGLFLGFACANLMESMLYGVSSHDPATYLATCALVLAIALIATCVPARRAARVDPMQALRYE